MKKTFLFFKIFITILGIVILCTIVVKCDSKVTLKELQEKGYNQHQIDSILERRSDELLGPALLMG